MVGIVPGWRKPEAFRVVLAGLVVFLLTVAPLAARNGAEKRMRVDTDQFTFIYSERDRATALEAITMGPDVYRRVTDYLGYTPRERVPVVIYGDTAIANGFFTPYPPHIALFVSSPSGPWMGASTESWIETLFIHELIHYVHLTQPVGFFGRPSRVFGPLISGATLLFAPGWFIEGPTTYGESALAPGGRGDNPFFEMKHIAPILEGRMYSYDQAGFMSAFAPSGRIYAAGYLMVDHLLENYGNNSFIELNANFQRAPFFGMRRAIKKTTGVSAREFYDNTVAALKAAYAPRRALPSGRLISPARQGDWTLPVATERGLITYGHGFSELPGLYLLEYSQIDTASGDLSPEWNLITPVNLADEWSWSVDRAGHTAVVSVPQPPPSGRFQDASSSDLFVLDTNGSRPPRRLTRDARLFHPALSANGNALVAVERKGSHSRLVTVDINDGASAALYEPESTTLFNPVFSPDGLLIAITENHRGRQWILVLDASTGQPLARVADRSGSALYFPRFTDGLDGLELWFGGDRDGRLSVYRSRVSASVAVSADLTLEVSNAQLMVEDQVAAYAGYPYNPTGDSRHGAGRNTRVLYASYTADGYAVKLGEMHTTAGRSVVASPNADSAVVMDAPVIGMAPVTGSGIASGLGPTATVPTPSIENERRYRDLPRPILWIPQAGFRTGSDEDAQLDIGAFLVAASNLDHHDVSLSVTYNPWAAQPSALLSYTFAPRATSWNLIAGQDYTNDPGDQTTTFAITAQRTLLLQNLPAFTRFISAGAGLEYRDHLRSPSESGFQATLQAEDRISLEEIEARMIIQIARQNRLATRDFFGPTGSSLVTEIVALPEMLDNSQPRIETTNQAAFSIQPLSTITGTIGALQLLPTAVITTSSAGTALGSLPYLSGGFDDRHTTGPAAMPSLSNLGWLGRLAIRVPAGVYDSAWRGLGSTGTGLSFYVEQGGAFDSGSMMPTATTVVGSELALDLFFNMLPFRVTGGAAVRLPHPRSSTNSGWLVYGRMVI